MGFIDARNISVEQFTTGVQPLVSLSAVSAAGAGTALDGVVVRSTAVMSVTASGSVTAGSVQMQGSLDGTDWFSLGSPVTTSASATTQVVASNAFTRFVRASIATAITGGTVSASVALSG
jgi:hypothetical protein